ncbi:MAG TPA: response regulator [Verrucomicrobiae bacterium]|nr:response regulator [Verrucomicrobiae bacterium]
MSRPKTIEHGPQSWSPRASLYGIALAITVSYFLLGRLNSHNRLWVEVSLPLSSASVLLLCLSAAELYLFVQRIQRQNGDLRAASERELDLSQRLAFQRQTILNQISRALIDKLDVNQMPREVLEKIAQLFEADVVATWAYEKAGPANFPLKGVFGLNAHTAEQAEAIAWTFPQFANNPKDPHQHVAENPQRDLAPELGAFCDREKLACGAFSPIVRRDELVGIVGVFYRKPFAISPSLTAEMQTVATVIASAVQAEELYRDLVQVQKIESIGSLASGIAHDFNNVLAAILGCASYVKQRTDPKSPTYRYLEATETSAHRGAALTKQLLSFARREGPRVTVVSPNESIEQTLKMLERSFDKSILLQRQFAAELKPVEIDPSQLEQVILNISVNARDAMPEGGIFTITTRNRRLDVTDQYRPALPLPDGEYVVLGFRDTGHGMNPATVKRIFEPFFTTKGRGKGTGLGLSVVQNIVRNFGGELRVDSEVGQGTLFEVYLPATSKPLPAEQPINTTEVRGGRESVLLAEDEDVIREMAQLGLEAKGYKVITADDGASALAVYREQWKNIDIVIADMVMPRISGPELFARMKEINPDVRVIVSSGYSHDQEGQRMLKHGCLGFLQKPYNTDALCQAIRSVLDSGL